MARNHLALAVGMLMGGVAAAQGPIPTPIGDSGIEAGTVLVASGLNQPTVLTHARDGSGVLFAAERNGVVSRIAPDGTRSTFLNIASTTLGGGERGLLGLAFHPGYDDPSSPGYRTFYTYTSESAAGAPADFAPPAGAAADHHAVIAEWKASGADPSVADPASRREVLRVGWPASNHVGGAIAFSPIDDRLYIALGDGGGANDTGAGHSPGGNGQDPTNPLGSFLRIDPLAPALNPGSPDGVSANGQYRVPTDNPFVGSTDPGVDEIFATGFRNPYRFSFDSATGQLVAGDVGQGNIEEVDLVNLGGNYGWPLKEGSFLFDQATGGISASPVEVPGLIDPVLEYDHDEGISIIGGFVYRGAQSPWLQGKYIFGDLTGRLFVGDFSTGEIGSLNLAPGQGLLGSSLIGFGEDESGELYALSTNFSPTGGFVQRLVFAVPEPSSLLMAGAGLALITGVTWMRKRP